jgi:hypothetical protein
MSLEGFRDYLSRFTMTRLKDFHLTLLGTNPEKGNKRTLVSAILDLLSFGDDEERFLAWFSGLPEYLAAALEKTAFGGHISVSDLQKLCDIPVLGEAEPTSETRHLSCLQELRKGTLIPEKALSANFTGLASRTRRLLAFSHPAGGAPGVGAYQHL